MPITYQSEPSLGTNDFITVLQNSTLSVRRPVDNASCIQGMLDHADIIVTARDGKKIIGVARSVTDFNYCCYLSDLAVDQNYQHRGIGKELIAFTQKQLKDTCKLILLSAPAATEYYPKIGFRQHHSAWTLAATDLLPKD